MSKAIMVSLFIFTVLAACAMLLIWAFSLMRITAA